MQSYVPELLRAMAWERAKGELNSMLSTYYPTYEGNEVITDDYDLMSKIINDFIKEVESNM